MRHISTAKHINAERIKKKKVELILIASIILTMVAIPLTGSAMAKDYAADVEIDMTKEIVRATADGLDCTFDEFEKALDSIKVVKAPNVVGFDLKKAKEKLKKADVDISAVKVEKKKYKFSKLVKESETLFFGEVAAQKQSKTDITLTIAEADMKDPLTVEMVNFGGRLAWPVPDSQNITSRFGGRASPGGIGSTNHQGLDIAAPYGSSIIAVKSGIVKHASPYGGYGNCVIIEHENGYETLYGHMSLITCNVGDKVKPSDIIGRVGSTGISTGNHLHFGILKNGTFVDPEPYFTGKLNIKAGEEVSENEALMDEENQDTNKPEDETETEKEQTKKTKPTKPKKPDKENIDPAEPSEEQETEPQEPTQPTEPEKKPEPEPEPTPEPSSAEDETANE